MQISIHAPPRGATTFAGADRLSNQFQFTPLREGRREVMRLLYDAYGISIHAPPRGATLDKRGNLAYNHISIHAPPRGATTTKYYVFKRE